MRHCRWHQASRVLAFFCACWGALWGPAAQAQPAMAPGWTLLPLPAPGGAQLLALERAPVLAPLRYRVIAIPGSGCAGMGTFAPRYFAGLQHAQLLVLHKPGVDPWARTPAADCPPDFVQRDALSAWRAAAQQALTAWLAQQPALPTWLLGISEVAELLADLAPQLPHLAGLVLIGASGLDPQEAGALQAARLGQQAAWQALARAQAGPGVDTQVVQWRSLRYWRDLWQWRLAQPLRDGPWPLLHVWGGADALVPEAAYQRFAARARQRSAPYCALRLAGADHGLQGPAPGQDGLPQVWALLEQAARTQGQMDCPWRY